MDVSGRTFVERQTSINAAPDRVQVSIIPASFDLFAFDEVVIGDLSVCGPVLPLNNDGCR